MKKELEAVWAIELPNGKELSVVNFNPANYPAGTKVQSVSFHLRNVSEIDD